MEVSILHTGDRSVAMLDTSGPVYTAATPEEALGRLLLSDRNWRKVNLRVEITYGQPADTRHVYHEPGSRAFASINPTVQPTGDSLIRDMATFFNGSPELVSVVTDDDGEAA